MNILLLNFVRQIYWSDRENIELEILKRKLDSMCTVKLMTISENEIEQYEKDVVVCQKHNAYIFSVDFNTNSEIFDGIFQFSQFVKKVNSDALIFLIGKRAYLHSDCIIQECITIDYIVEGEPEDISDIIYKICMGEENYDKVIKISGGNNPLVRPSRNNMLISELKFAKIRTTRGCNGDCLFCIDKDGVGIKKIRTIKDVIEEIKEIVSTCNIKKICIYDNSFEDPYYTDKSRIREFINEIKNNNLKLYFDCSIRAESFKTSEDLELLKEMSRCGFYKIIVGFESGNISDLNFYHKRATLEDNYRIADFLNQAKINYIMPPGFIMFNPFTSIQSLLENYNFLKSINKGYSFFAFCSFLKVFTNSKMHQYLKNRGVTCYVESYRELVKYNYINKNVEKFADFLFEKRYTSITLSIGLQIDKLKDLVSQVTKKYVAWKDIDVIKANIDEICRLLEEYISIFWEFSIYNINDMQKIEAKYFELEEKSAKLSPQKCLKKFIAANYGQEELNYLI